MNTLYENIRRRRLELGMSQDDLANRLGYKSRSTIAKIEAGVNDITQSKIKSFAKALNTSVSALMGGWESRFDKHTLPQPNITEDYTTFPVIGDIAAGYDHIAVESWEGDTVDIPNSYLRGHQKSDFFVLTVRGDSMYPIYQEGDKVLILKQSTLMASGDIGAVIYDDEIATIKKVEFVKGEDWLRLVPLNPNFKPEEIRNERLEHCRVIGVPRLLIREVS